MHQLIKNKKRAVGRGQRERNVVIWDIIFMFDRP